MTADVVINGTKAVHHEGGYGAFRADITQYLKDENKLEVYVDNSDNTKVYPQKADFTFYGGLYRMVKLVTVSKNHFELDYAGGTGHQSNTGGYFDRCRSQKSGCKGNG